MNYNPYFPGGGIAMARVLYDGLVEYDDGELALFPVVFFFLSPILKSSNHDSIINYPFIVSKS